MIYRSNDTMHASPLIRGFAFQTPKTCTTQRGGKPPLMQRVRYVYNCAYGLYKSAGKL